MTRYSPQLFETRYRCTRRTHRHRCRACMKILQDGDAVLGTRIAGKRATTWFLHVNCADKDEFGMTWRQRAEAWNASVRADDR